MRRPALIAAALMVLAAPCVADPTEAPPVQAPGEPVKLVRTLELMQDQIARGKPQSESARRALIEAIARRLLEAPPDTWTDTRNRDAALVYVLSGGTPAVLDRLPAYDDKRQQLVAAIRAEATGVGPQAVALWDAVDPATLPPSLVAPVALAKATWLIESDPKKAVKLLDLARLHAPGTLIEEAAIRRGIEIAASLKDAARFEELSIRYAVRFPYSMYAQAFRARFSEFYLAVAPQADGDATEMLDNILASVPPKDRCDTYLEIARRALVEGKVKLTKSAAERAMTLATGPSERPRAEFYLAAALALLGDPASNSLRLELVEAQNLRPRDRELLSAVAASLNAIHAWPELTAGPPMEMAAGEPDGNETVAQAQDALLAAEQLLSDLDRKGG